MNSAYEDIIISRLLSFSREKTDIEIAKKEWSFEGLVIDHGPIKDQVIKSNCALCGHPIRYGYVLENKAADRKIEIGSECIGNYEIVHPARLEGALKKLKRDQYNQWMNAFNGASWTVANLQLFITRKINDSGHDWFNPLNAGTRADHDQLNTNNEVILFKILQAGIPQKIAEKYNFPLRQDYIKTFMEIYPAADKTKHGFFKRN